MVSVIIFPIFKVNKLRLELSRVTQLASNGTEIQERCPDSWRFEAQLSHFKVHFLSTKPNEVAQGIEERDRWLGKGS